MVVSKQAQTTVCLEKMVLLVMEEADISVQEVAVGMVAAVVTTTHTMAPLALKLQEVAVLHLFQVSMVVKQNRDMSVIQMYLSSNMMELLILSAHLKYGMAQAISGITVKQQLPGGSKVRLVQLKMATWAMALPV